MEVGRSTTLAVTRVAEASAAAFADGVGAAAAHVVGNCGWNRTTGPLSVVAEAYLARAVNLDPLSAVGPEEGPVGAVEVLQYPVRALDLEHRVRPGNPGIVDRDFGGRVAADPVRLPALQVVVPAQGAHHQVRRGTETGRNSAFSWESVGFPSLKSEWGRN